MNGEEAIKPFLEMRGIVKQFPGVLALNRVDFDLRPGEVHVLLGENGAGKSTLIKILSGVHTADEGEILLDGRPVHIRTPHDAKALGISTIFQEFTLVPDMSVAENIFLGRFPSLPGAAGFVDWKRMREESAALLRSLNVEVDPRTPVRQLGVAKQQMVEIAKALSMQARIIVMDEPTAALASAEIEQLFRTIRELKARGVAVIYISHRLEEVRHIGDRATVLRDGEKIGTVPLATTSIDDLIRMMVGRELKEKFPKVEVPRGEEILRVEHLSRPGVLHDISFNLFRGEILGIAGLVGAGRTELARAIFGADPISGGRVLVKGQPVQITSPRDAIRHGLALLPEDRKRHGLVLGMTVAGNITITMLDQFTRAGVMDLRKERSLAQQFVERIRIATPSLDREVRYLSGGNQQKVVVAKWVGAQADIFLFDEPTRGIDVGAKVEVYHLMNELVQKGAGVIMISSELPEILGMSDRILVMRAGRICGMFHRSEATPERILDAAISGEPVYACMEA